MYAGMALWTLGAGLKVLFCRTTPVSVYVIVLIIEGTGIGFVLQPGETPGLSIKSLILTHMQLLLRCKHYLRPKIEPSPPQHGISCECWDQLWAWPYQLLSSLP